MKEMIVYILELDQLAVVPEGYVFRDDNGPLYLVHAPNSLKTYDGYVICEL